MVGSVLTRQSSPPPPDDWDPWGGAGADMSYDKPGDSGDEEARVSRARESTRVRVALRVRYNRSIEVKLSMVKIDFENDYEQMCENELARHEHISRVTGRPWDEAPEQGAGSVLPWHWSDDLGSHVWPHHVRKRLEQVQEQKVPPPLRDDPKYGQRSANPRGDERFRADRVSWFQSVTGESLEGLSLAEQWQRAHRVARAFRADTRDGRPGRSLDS